MLETKTKEKLADVARTLAASYEIVLHGEVLYLPVDYLTGVSEPIPDPERKVWKPLDRTEVQRFGNVKAKILFANESELVNFEGMLKQLARRDEARNRGVFITTDKGLRVLDSSGNLVEPEGLFRPNHIAVPLNTDKEMKERIFNILQDWLGGSSLEAHSLLHHLATTLAPSWSAVKYVLFLGEGRNGKSVLLQMMIDILGRHNVSNVTRAQMSEQSPVCADLNGKLANIVMDGAAQYLTDSGMEKTLIAGETAAIRPLYVSRLVPVQTNGLFIEALNQEPKTRDKSSALQKRLVRFRFPNVYELNIQFASWVREPEPLGAFLALLVDHYVTETTVQEKLQPTQAALELQMDQVVINSVFHQFILHLMNTDLDACDKLIGKDVATLVTAFQPWALDTDSKYTESDILNLFKRNIVLKRSSRRDRAPRNYWKIMGWKADVQALIEHLKNENPDDVEDHDTSAT